MKYYVVYCLFLIIFFYFMGNTRIHMAPHCFFHLTDKVYHMLLILGHKCEPSYIIINKACFLIDFSVQYAIQCKWVTYNFTMQKTYIVFISAEVFRYNVPSFHCLVVMSYNPCAKEFYSLNKSIDFILVWTSKHWDLGWACYPKTTESSY